MLKNIFICLIFLLVLNGYSFAIDVPPPPIDIDISNSSFENIDSTSFRIRQLIAPDYPGTYWVDFLWNRDNLLFEPICVGSENTSYGKHRVSIVDKSGKFYSDPVEAMQDVTTWCGTPSETNPCLLKILPGIYDIGSNTLHMHQYIDIEGSGENITRIIGNGTEGVISARQYAEMRSLTIEHIGGVDSAIAMYIFQSNPSLKDITIIVKGNNNVNYGIYLDSVLFDIPTAFVKIKNVTITASGGTANYGVYNNLENSRVTIINSAVKGTTRSVFTKRGITLISGSQLDGISGGNTKCAGVYDENFTFFVSTCP
jgi:hypothetical protein